MTQAKTVQSTHESIEKLQLRLYKLTTRSHLRIGAGEGSISLSAADNPVIQALFYTPPDSDESSGSQQRVIYLPGSSLHGVIRAWAEKIARSDSAFLSDDEIRNALNGIADKEGLLQNAKKEVKDYLGQEPDEEQLYQYWRVHKKVCDPLSLLDQCQRFGQAAEGQTLPAKQEWFSQLKKLHGRENPCPICQVFGYVGQRGRVRIQPAFPAKGNLPLDIITRVAINRISGAADEGKLFDMEAIPPGAVFYFYVVLENMNDNQIKVFENGITALQLQLATLGAHSTVGFGTVELEPVLTAKIQPTLFNIENLSTRVKEIVKDKDMKLIRDAQNLDASRYPTFYRALTMVDKEGKRSALFNGTVTFSKG